MHVNFFAHPKLEEKLTENDVRRKNMFIKMFGFLNVCVDLNCNQIYEAISRTTHIFHTKQIVLGWQSEPEVFDIYF